MELETTLEVYNLKRAVIQKILILQIFTNIERWKICCTRVEKICRNIHDIETSPLFQIF